jgi:hypothetical protein
MTPLALDNSQMKVELDCSSGVPVKARAAAILAKARKTLEDVKAQRGYGRFSTAATSP